MNDKYLHFELNDFLEDPNFVSEVLSGHPNKKDWEQWLKDNPSKREEYELAIKSIKNLRFKDQFLSEEDKVKVWKHIEANTEAAVIPSGRHFLKFTVFSAAAAALALVVYFLFGISSHTTISTVSSEHISYVLPDESKVELNAATMIRFNNKKWSEERKVRMSGEAFFSVKKGSSFIVETSLGQVKVLGTRFNVYKRDSVFEVKCQSGKVRVISNDSDSLELVAGEAVLFDLANQKRDRYTINADRINEWVSGTFSYEEISLDIIFKELERQFDIMLDFPADLSLTEKDYTGSFNNGDLDAALRSVCWPMHLDYKINGKIVQISLRQ